MNRTKEIVIGIAVTVVFSLLIYFGMNMFTKENEKEPVVNMDNDITEKDYIEFRIQVTGIDPVKGDFQLRVNPEPVGNFTEDKITLAKEVTVYTNSTSGKNEFNFPKGKRMYPFDVTVEMYDGSVMKYPYDKHSAYLSMIVTTQEKDSTGKVTTIDVPIVKETEFYTSIQGYRLAEAKEVDAGEGYSDIEFKIERTASILLFSRFIMILMWFMTIAVVLLMGSILLRNRKLEYSMFAFLSAMLFALPALRNVQPFVPTIGCLSDYVAFFWAEGAVAVSLIIMIFTWLKRPGPKHT